MSLVQPYDPAWPTWFERVKTFLAPGLPDSGCAVEHVGSTSVPGMVAKPIIDIDLVIKRGTFPDVKARLDALGYVHQGDLGVPGREAFDLVNAEAKARLPVHYLYVCETDAPELRRHLAFRDFLREHPEWCERLSQLKQALCVDHNNDRQAYMDGKAAMVRDITARAMGCIN
ncbi:MAG: GrpB family protein [bacterium]|nr:GrpB family protein [bacterium]